MSNDFRSVT